jgi:GH18 family chitinase
MLGSAFPPIQIDENFQIARVEDNDAQLLREMKGNLTALAASARPKLMMSVGGWSMSRSDGPVFGKSYYFNSVGGHDMFFNCHGCSKAS